MRYLLNADILAAYPDLRVGVVVGRDMKNGQNSPQVTEMITQGVTSFLDRFAPAGVGVAAPEDFSAHRNIVAWREAYRSSGVKPKKHKPTAEALLRRVLNHHEFPRINNAVDAYLAVELVFCLPIGGYDLDHVSGDIQLRYSPGGEEFLPLGGSGPETTDCGEVVYADDASILTRRWNYRDADHSKITENSTSILLASEAVYRDITDEDLHGTIEAIMRNLRESCGGDYVSYFLDSESPAVVL